MGCLQKTDVLKANKHYPLVLPADGTFMWGLIDCKSTVQSEGVIVSFKIRFSSYGDCFKSVAFAGKLQVMNAKTEEVLNVREFHESEGDAAVSIDVQDLSNEIRVEVEVDELKPTAFTDPQAFFDRASSQ